MSTEVWTDFMSGVLIVVLCRDGNINYVNFVHQVSISLPPSLRRY